ncbi:hypothetical protein [Streptomyces abikoensis]|uniref:hypothetical protein n=1 Tax=Streptomyces abikoensis TaxID=97398 RepID=UPI0036A358EF
MRFKGIPTGPPTTDVEADLIHATAGSPVSTDLPRFRYHPDPVASGSAMLFRCTVCGTHLAYADAS